MGALATGAAAFAIFIVLDPVRPGIDRSREVLDLVYMFGFVLGGNVWAWTEFRLNQKSDLATAFAFMGKVALLSILSVVLVSWLTLQLVSRGIYSS